MFSIWQAVDNIHILSWSQRISYIVIFVAVVVNMRCAFEDSIEGPWRRMYLYKGSVSLIGWVYYTLLIVGTFTTKDYIAAARWLQPLILTGLCTSAFLHKWEIKNLRTKKELEHRLKAAIEREEDG